MTKNYANSIVKIFKSRLKSSIHKKNLVTYFSYEIEKKASKPLSLMKAYFESAFICCKDIEETTYER